MGVAFAQAASSSLPSMVIAPEAAAALATGRDADVADVVCALDAPAVPRKSATASVMKCG